MADSLEKNIWMMKSAVPRSMEMKGLVGSALLISDTSISSPTCTTFNGDLNIRVEEGDSKNPSLPSIVSTSPDLVGHIADEDLLQSQEIHVRNG